MASAVSNLVRQAATEIGLNATIKSVSAADYINFFPDAGARKGIDIFPTRPATRWPRYAGTVSPKSQSSSPAANCAWL